MCVLKSPIHKRLVEEAYGGGLACHFGVNKTNIFKEHFYKPEMRGDVHDVFSKCVTCHRAKSQFHQGIYCPFSVLQGHWEDVSMDFNVALPRIQRDHDANMVVIGQVTMMAYFVPFHKSEVAAHIVHLYFRENPK